MNKSSEFYNRSVKPFLHNDIEIYSTHNEGKSVIATKIIRTLKSKIYKYMTSVSKTVLIDKLDAIVNKYNSTYYSTIKMKPVYVKSSTYIDSSKEINDKDPKFKLVILLEYWSIKIFLQKATLKIGLKKFLWLKKLKILCCGHILLMVLMEKKLLESFYIKELLKTNQRELKIEEVIKKEGDKLYVT